MMKYTPEAIENLIAIGAVATPTLEYYGRATHESEHEAFLENCRQHEFHTIENVSYSNGRWHATAVKNGQCFHIDYETKSKSLMQGKQVI